MRAHANVVQRNTRAQPFVNGRDDALGDEAIAEVRLIGHHGDEKPGIAQSLHRRRHSRQQPEFVQFARRVWLSISDLCAVEHPVAIDKDRTAARQLHHFVAWR